MLPLDENKLYVIGRRSDMFCYDTCLMPPLIDGLSKDSTLLNRHH